MDIEIHAAECHSTCSSNRIKDGVASGKVLSPFEVLLCFVKAVEDPQFVWGDGAKVVTHNEVTKGIIEFPVR